MRYQRNTLRGSRPKSVHTGLVLGHPRPTRLKAADYLARMRGGARGTLKRLARMCRQARVINRPEILSASEVFMEIIETAIDAGEMAPICYRDQLSAAVKEYGSQRKAAAALGISLGKLQRELRKASAA